VKHPARGWKAPGGRKSGIKGKSSGTKSGNSGAKGKSPVCETFPDGGVSNE